MREIVETIDMSGLKVEIDRHGGVHFHHNRDPPLRLSPERMQEIEEMRKAVMYDE